MNSVTKILVTFLALLGVVSCSTPERLDAVPDNQLSQAVIPGFPDVRYFVDGDDGPFINSVLEAAERERTYSESIGITELPPINVLAISGGGDYGAFGAGLLVGWTEAGDRPEFKVVTGVSTGALMAPFAFLGSDYDDQLREVYTTISADDIFEQRSLLSIPSSDGAADTTPLKELIAKYLDEDMMAAIAEEYRQGRLLYVATTNMDSLKAVIWDIGKIANSDNPEALNLIHEVLRASASIPAAFSPVMFDVEIDGEPYQEMHVDGGMAAQVFVYPPSLDIKQVAQESGIDRERNLYIVRNWRVNPEWASVDRKIFEITERSMLALLELQGNGDLYVIFTQAKRDGLDYNLAYIPDEFSAARDVPFDTGYMNRLFDYAYALSKDGNYEWTKVPPGFAVRSDDSLVEDNAEQG